MTVGSIRSPPRLPADDVPRHRRISVPVNEVVLMIKKRTVIGVVLAFGLFSLVAQWMGFFGRGWGWYPTHQKRELTAPEG